MKPMRTIATLTASALLMWGSAQAAPEAPETGEGVPVIILELAPQPGVGGAQPSEQEQAMMAMLLLQLLMGMEPQGGAPDGPAPISAPKPAGGQRI